MWEDYSTCLPVLSGSYEYLHGSQWHQELIPALQTFFSLVYVPLFSCSQCGQIARSDPDTLLRWGHSPPSSHAARLCVYDAHLCVRRYLFALQVKQDLAQGRLTCNDTSAALLISHIVQCKFCWFSLEITLEIIQWSDWLKTKSHPWKQY